MNNEKAIGASTDFIEYRGVKRTIYITAYLAEKRALDFLVSVFALMFLFIPMCIIALLIRIDSPGPVIFSQERLGLNGEKFMIHKFRSMKMNAEENGPQWARIDDQRCTKIGRKLRNFHLDELPQLWNILLGEMSFVGPRPEREFFYNQFEKIIPGFRERLCVQPGLTGWAQVNGGYNLTPEEKLKYDMEYIRKRNFLFDAKCVLKTIKLVFTHDGAR